MDDVSYYSLGAQQARAVLEKEAEEGSGLDLALLSRRGRGPLLSDDHFDSLLFELLALIESIDTSPRFAKSRKGSEFERRAARIVHEFVSPLPRYVKGDMGFWRWLALGPLRPIVEWRFSTNDGEVPSATNYGVGTASENLIYRSWIRGAIGLDPTRDDPYELVEVDDHELWRSHLQRQRYANDRNLTRALLRLQNEEIRNNGAIIPRLSIAEIRKLAPRLKALRANVIFTTLSDEEVEQIVRDQVQKIRATHTRA